jgi:hypothetical protein
MFFKSLSLLCILTSFNANAAGFFEPYAGVNVATFNQQISNIHGTVNGATINTQSAQVSGDFSGLTLGLRVYEKFLNQFMLGGDLGLGFSSGKLNLDVLSSMGNYNIITYTPGLIIGWDIPTILLPRIWAGFYPINSLHLTKDGDTKNIDKYGGHSFKFGVSFDWWVQFGIEFSSHQEKLKYDEVIVTLSYPFSL